MSNEYAGLVSESKYDKLEAENKIMQDDIDKLETRLCDALIENKALKVMKNNMLSQYKGACLEIGELKQVRDELLNAVVGSKNFLIESGSFGVFVSSLTTVIKKAQQQKEKEVK